MKSNAVAYTKLTSSAGRASEAAPRVYGSKIKLRLPVASLQRPSNQPQARSTARAR